VDAEGETITFPLLTIDRAKLIGYQRYQWDAEKIRGNVPGRKQRYYTWMPDAYKGMAIYGWDNCFGHGPLFVTEGIFDALKVTNCWHDCVALLTNSPSKQFKQWFRDVTRYRRVIALMDSGESHDRWQQIANKTFYPPNNYDDIGDVPLEEVQEFLINVVL